MKKVNLELNESLKFEWDTKGTKGVHGGAIFGLLCRFNDLLLYVCCNPTLPPNMTYGNHFHGCFERVPASKEILKAIVGRSHRMAGRIQPAGLPKTQWLELWVEFFEGPGETPLAKLLITKKLPDGEESIAIDSMGNFMELVDQQRASEQK